jgi:hypothetical protein
VHAGNFGRVLTRLGEELAPLPRPVVTVGAKHADGIDAVQCAWASVKRHRHKIQQIQRGTPAFFETVARTIDQKTGRYFIFPLCGSTVNKFPGGACPICKNPPTQ